MASLYSFEMGHLNRYPKLLASTYSATSQNHLHKNIAIIVVIHTISDATALASRHLITVHPTRVAVRVPASNAAHAVIIDLINMAHNPKYIAATIPPTKIKTAKMNLIPFFRVFAHHYSSPAIRRTIFSANSFVQIPASDGTSLNAD